MYGFDDGEFDFQCVDEGEDVYSKDSKNGLPIATAAFFEGGVRVPFSPLLVYFLNYCRFVSTQLGLNAFRIISRVDALNKALGTNLGLMEIFHHYKLIPLRGKENHYLSLRFGREPLVTHFTDSNPRIASHIIFVYENVDESIPGQNIKYPRKSRKSCKY